MGYSIDLKKISVPTYREMLKKQNLLPGRRILLDNIEENFRKITGVGVQNLSELKAALSSPKKLSEFAEKTDIPADYLTILKREAGSLEQKPVPLADFPGVSADTVSALSEKKIKTSKDVYNLSVTDENIAEISRETGVSEGELRELNCLCSLVRINGVGAIAARTIYEGGYKSVGDIARANASELLERMNSVNAEKKYYKANLGEKDMQFIIDAANIIEEFAERN